MSRLCHVDRQATWRGDESQVVTWIFTREAADSADACATLAARGLAVRSVPCVEFGDLPWPTWRGEGRRPVMFLTSKRSARRFAECAWPSSATEPGLVAALGPVTTDFLAQRRVRVDLTAHGGVVPLAAQVRTTWESFGRPAWAIRYPTSTLGLDAPEQHEALELLSQVGPVQREAVYETRAPAGLAQALRAMTHSAWSVTFSSPSAVTAFLRNLSPDALPPGHVVCLGGSTQRAWNQHKPLQWREAVITSNVVDTIVALEELQ
jgi:uroporphyrinogen-III synthase